MAACTWDSSSSPQDYLPLDDSEYPFAGVSRLVIETDNFRGIRDKETKIKAKLQIYEKDGPSSEIMTLTVSGRGYSSFWMSKYGIKLDFDQKQSLFGMPKGTDFALVANFRDKTHVKNYVTYQLASILGDDYSPRAQFVEVFFNREYIGLYLLVESVKVSKNRVNLNKDKASYLVEKTTSHDNKPFFETKNGNLFEIKYPKAPSQESIGIITEHFEKFEAAMKNTARFTPPEWIDTLDFARYYWIQEFAKNFDARFLRSIFITWEQEDVLKMGPVWDFDLAYGIYRVGTINHLGWLLRDSEWFKWLWRNEEFKTICHNYWTSNKHTFKNVPDSIETVSQRIKKAVKNDNKRWPTLNSTENMYHDIAFESYEKAIDSLKNWVSERYYWIDENL